ncbi:MAG: hypothetical protein M3O31_12700 [Acidobacteriota bacterium]|nr:hypothetical protein [Acidobacteriota bacterium]
MHSQVAKTNLNDAKERKKLLVEQVASSAYFSKSARLRDMFIYVCDRVLDQEVDEIHEQEVGRRVFGRPADYDTSADNTVRVHASMLRKRVEQYFATEGCGEPIVIEIPRGNYAPVFRERRAIPVLPEVSSAPVNQWSWGWRIWLPTTLAVVFAAVSVALYVQNRQLQRSRVLVSAPTVRQFWSQVFQPNRQSDLVLGDASLALFEERTGKPVQLSEYFDRSYLNKASDRDTAAKIDPDLAKVLLLKRQTNYGDVALLAQFTDLAHAEQSDTKVRFAREYSFREMKADNAVLLGNFAVNPWVEPFQSRQTLHWRYDADRGNYYPVDTTATTAEQEKYHGAPQPGQVAEGYAVVALLPNMGGTGNVLILSGTGGAAMSGLLSFLSDEQVMGQLRAQLNAGANSPFPYFEALMKIGSRNSLPRDSSILIARRLHP